jgi:hypothetical protein
MTLLQFMGEHPFLTFFLVWVVCHSLVGVVYRFFRHLDISKHGWPATPNMDADGDIVHPEPEEA